jgi:sortase A
MALLHPHSAGRRTSTDAAPLAEQQSDGSQPDIARPIESIATATQSKTGESNGTNPRNARHGAQGPSSAFTPTPFAEAIDISDLMAERRRLQRNLLVMRIIIVVLLIISIAVTCFPLVLQLRSSRELVDTTITSAKEVAGWPYPEAENKLKAAHAYNEKLAGSSQAVLGEATDPFSATQGGSQASGEDSAATKDTEYQSLLDAGGEVMGTIKVPKQSINLPIYHGTSEKALASGAGHLYGTSLPVGGKSTHSVITGHRGLVEALMFTRLDEMKKDDFFYVEVMGKTLGYKVDRISVILPDDSSQLKIVPGEDRVTLMTCTPYGVNTHRLLVSGHRVKIPVPAPEPDDVPDVHNAAIIGIIAGAGVLLAGLFIIGFARRRQVAITIRHAAGWPWQYTSHGGTPRAS